MKTFIFVLIFIFFLDVGLTQQENKIKTANNWNFLPSNIMPRDSLKTGTILDSSNGFQIFSTYGDTYKLSGINGNQTTWYKYFTSYPRIPDTINLDVKVKYWVNVTELNIVIATQDSNTYCYYYWKSLNLNNELQTISWDMTEMKTIMQNFGKFYLIFILLTKDSCYVGADVAVDNLRGIDDTLGVVVYDTFEDPTSVSENPRNTPISFGLSQNYPNPFNPSTRISYTLQSPELVTLRVYDVLGNEVAMLVNQYQSAGNHTVSFDANNLASGMYFYKLEAGSFQSIKKMMLLK